MRRRSASAIGIGAVFAIVASLVAGVPVASGCQEPDLFIPGGSYGPGDPVPFSVSGTDSGATVAIDVGGQHFSFSDPGGEPGFAGSFPMPDMGDSPQSVPYDADVTHTDEGVPHTWSDPGSISFEPAAAPAGDGAGGNPSPTPNPAGHAQAPAPSTGGSELPVASGADTSSGTSSAANAGADTVHRGATQPVAATASVQHHREVSTATAASRGSRHQTASPATARRHAAVGRPAPSAVGIPSYAVLGLAGLIVLAGAVGLAVAAMRRGGGGAGDLERAEPPWLPPSIQAEARLRSLLIEAELQEMIAEERARERLLREPAERPTESAPSGRSAAASRV